MSALQVARTIVACRVVEEAGLEEFAQAVSTVRELRGDKAALFEIAAALPPGTDVAPYGKVGATWWMTEFEPAVSLGELRGGSQRGSDAMTSAASPSA